MHLSPWRLSLLAVDAMQHVYWGYITVTTLLYELCKYEPWFQSAVACSPSLLPQTGSDRRRGGESILRAAGKVWMSVCSFTLTIYATPICAVLVQATNAHTVSAFAVWWWFAMLILKGHTRGRLVCCWWWAFVRSMFDFSWLGTENSRLIGWNIILVL